MCCTLEYNRLLSTKLCIVSTQPQSNKKKSIFTLFSVVKTFAVLWSQNIGNICPHKPSVLLTEHHFQCLKVQHSVQWVALWIGIYRPLLQIVEEENETPTRSLIGCATVTSGCPALSGLACLWCTVSTWQRWMSLWRTWWLSGGYRPSEKTFPGYFYSFR